MGVTTGSKKLCVQKPPGPTAVSCPVLFTELMKGKKKKSETGSRRSCVQWNEGRKRRTPLQQHRGLNLKLKV